ncbi:nitrogen regulatory IIA protein [Chryseobacterium sp. Ch-15]|uniref:Nitrogen regulatory IIA protein n=1 Tax=Chryseobacterium muglaense TaxID=2893752 RepID=A0A9Q3YT90_9FLAO|nr:nitrogen regulatory IIA protein [Chryseobacterium muglaense]MBD3905384.1 nitrogen regulatory IIA protein [Chryseobacterium muglaense]MCC9036891.1 nitrogen regulatory IIA protein [Chryseobacterium muglaense]MCM2555247.1 nitrogen regulatory IIA protein [Chryseobacterium muglaense]
MKKLRLKIDNSIEKLESKWNALPVKEQHRFTKGFFIGYALITLFALFGVWFTSGESSKILSIGHINNIPKDLGIQTNPLQNSVVQPQQKITP